MINAQAVAAASLLLSASCLAQSIVPTGQVRRISGESFSTVSGNTFGSGPLVTDAVEGDYGTWAGSLTISGFVNGTNSQTGGFNGTDTISLDAFSLSLGGGNGPGTSGSATVRNEFTYMFTVGNGAEYSFYCGVGCAGPGGAPMTTNDWAVTAFLVGPNGDEFRFATGPESGYTINVPSQTGTLVGGAYTLSFIGTGSVSFEAPEGSGGNGAGGGAGAGSPVMTFTVTGGQTGTCAADVGTQGGTPGQDNVLDNNDFVVFIDFFFAHDSRADRGVQGGVPGSDNQWDNNDFVVFIDQFFAGC